MKRDGIPEAAIGQVPWDLLKGVFMLSPDPADEPASRVSGVRLETKGPLSDRPSTPLLPAPAVGCTILSGLNFVVNPHPPLPCLVARCKIH